MGVPEAECVTRLVGYHVFLQYSIHIIVRYSLRISTIPCLPHTVAYCIQTLHSIIYSSTSGDANNDAMCPSFVLHPTELLAKISYEPQRIRCRW